MGRMPDTRAVKPSTRSRQTRAGHQFVNTITCPPKQRRPNVPHGHTGPFEKCLQQTDSRLGRKPRKASVDATVHVSSHSNHTPYSGPMKPKEGRTHTVHTRTQHSILRSVTHTDRHLHHSPEMSERCHHRTVRPAGAPKGTDACLALCNWCLIEPQYSPGRKLGSSSFGRDGRSCGSIVWADLSQDIDE